MTRKGEKLSIKKIINKKKKSQFMCIKVHNATSILKIIHEKGKSIYIHVINVISRKLDLYKFSR